MNCRNTLPKFDSINNRILVRNSHKFVYKKLCSAPRDQWCQKYLSVATSKLLDPKSTTKLPFSLKRKSRKQQSTSFSCSHTTLETKKFKKQALSIEDYENLCNSTTIQNIQLINASKKAQKLLEKMRKSVVKPILMKKDSNKYCRESK